MLQYIINGVIAAGVSYFITVFIFDLLLRGFAPFIPSRPWVVSEILDELEISQAQPKMLAFSCGRSGFFRALEKKYPEAELLGLEFSFFPYLVAKVQSLLRRTKIKIVKKPIHRVEVKNFDFIYSHLYPEEMEGLGKKLKYECRPGTQVVSTGFNIPNLEPKKIIDLPDRKGRLDFLSKNQKLFQRKSKKYKKEPKAYFYEI